MLWHSLCFDYASIQGIRPGNAPEVTAATPTWRRWMKRNGISLLAAALLVSLAACDGRGDQGVARDTVMTTVPREDTIAVERTVETDTIRDTRP